MTGRHYLDRVFSVPFAYFFINDYTLLYLSYKFSCGFLPKIFFIFLRIAIFPCGYPQLSQRVSPPYRALDLTKFRFFIK